MRRAYNGSAFHFTQSGNLVAIATGSDATSEHEWGISPLLEAFTCTPKENMFDRLAKKFVPETYPNQFEQKLIKENLDQIKFHAEKEEAVLWVSLNHTLEYTDLQRYYGIELRFFDGEFNDNNLMCAWDESSFAIRVRTKKYVKALKQFHEALLQGKCAFGGKFFKRDGFRGAGIVLVNTQYLSAEDKVEIDKAQREFESKIRLQAKDESLAITREIKTVYGDVGFLWADWKDEAESEVIYRLNPSNRVSADYGGPYTKEQLLEWAKAKGSYRLTSSL